MALPADFNIDAALGTQLPGQSPTENAAPAPASPTGSAQVPSSQLPKDFNIDRALNNGQATDQLTGANIPLAYSGNTAETAMNKNALSATDRMNMGFGNVRGNIKYLKEKFPDAKEITGPDGKPTGELAYRQGSTWYRANPVNGDISDPWEKTKEYMKDAASLTPEALGVAVATGSALLTDFASVPKSAAIAGAAAATARTSLGRLIGTYDATPAEQAWDIGFESMLNAAGAKILPGVKPRAKWVAGVLSDVSEAFKDVVESYPVGAKASGMIKAGAESLADTPKAIFKKIFATYSVGENNFDTMVENTPAVKNTMTRLSDMAGGDVQAYHDQAIRDQVGKIGEIASGARNTLTQIYGSMRNKLLSKVPSDFSINLEDSVYASYKSALDNGIGKITVGGKDLLGKEAIEYLAENGTTKAGFNLLSPDELQLAIAKGGTVGNGVGYLAANPEAHATLDTFYKNLGKFAGGADRTGVQGAKDLLDFKKVASDLARDASTNPTVQGSFDVRNVINSAKSAIDDNVFQSLKKVGAHDDFLNLNATYDKLSTGFSPLLNAQKQAIASGNTKSYEGLLNSFLSRPKPSATARFAIDDAIAAADSNGLGKLAEGLRQSKLDIQIGEAAKAFNPIKSSMLKADSLGMGQVAMAYYAIAHPAFAATAIGMTALRSPTVSKGAIATVQGLSQGQEVLANLTKKQLGQFLDNPQALSAFTTGVLQAPLVRGRADQAMQQALQMATQRPQPAAPQQQMPMRGQGR